MRSSLLALTALVQSILISKTTLEENKFIRVTQRSRHGKLRRVTDVIQPLYPITIESISFDSVDAVGESKVKFDLKYRPGTVEQTRSQNSMFMNLHSSSYNCSCVVLSPWQKIEITTAFGPNSTGDNNWSLGFTERQRHPRLQVLMYNFRGWRSVCRKTFEIVENLPKSSVVIKC